MLTNTVTNLLKSDPLRGWGLSVTYPESIKLVSQSVLENKVSLNRDYSLTGIHNKLTVQLPFP